MDPHDVSATSETRESERRFIGRYEIRRLLGTGGMGHVYLAHDPVLDREVAVKLIGSELDDEKARHRLVEEARAAGRLRHPNIVTIFDAGEHAGAPYIAMEHVGGETLRGLIRRRAPLPLAHRLELIEGACAGLAHAHRANVVHFDVKPDNLMLDAGGVLKVLDFGIARVLKGEVLVTKHLVGTLRYMSPEQISGNQLDRRSDVFSLGCSLFELIAYAPAYTGSAVDLIGRIAQGPVPRLADAVPSVDPRLDALVARAMALDPAQRFDDLDELGVELGRLSDELEPGRQPRRASFPVPSSSTVPADSPPAPRRLVLAGVGAASALVIGLVMVWMLGNTPPPIDAPVPAPAPAPTSASQAPSAQPQPPALVEPVASGAVPPPPSAAARPTPPADPGPAVPAAAGEDVWRRLARGDRAGVIELLRVAERRQVNPRIAHEVLDAVRPAALRARTDLASPTQRASAAYRSADESLTRANLLAEGGQPIEALGALWQAIDAFGSVASASRAVAAAVPPPPQAASQDAARGSPPPSNNAEPARTPADTSVPSPSTSDRDVLAALGRFHQAYTALDLAAVRQMYPTLGPTQVEDLRRTFETSTAYDIDLRQPRVEVNDNTAVVRGLVVRRIVPRVGRAQTSEVQSEFRLQRDARGWLVVEVKAVP